jgi:hypothetical protein
MKYCNMYISVYVSGRSDCEFKINELRIITDPMCTLVRDIVSTLLEAHIDTA